MSRLSQAIVDFIAQPSPLYTSQHVDDRECALSLLDGTLVLPQDESTAEPEQGRMTMYWQGDRSRRLEIPGPQLASVAIWQHLQANGYSRSADDMAAQRQQLAQRFHRCVGRRLQREPTTTG